MNQTDKGPEGNEELRPITALFLHTVYMFIPIRGVSSQLTKSKLSLVVSDVMLKTYSSLLCQALWRLVLHLLRAVFVVFAFSGDAATEAADVLRDFDRRFVVRPICLPTFDEDCGDQCAAD